MIAPTTDSTKTDTVQPAKSTHTDTTANPYPKVTVYSGQLISKFDVNPTETNSAFMFSVGETKTPTDSIAFNSVIPVNSANSSNIILAQFAVNDSNTYTCPSKSDVPPGGSYTFKLINDSLYVTWDYSQKLIGTCYDVGECKGHFAGKLVK